MTARRRTAAFPGVGRLVVMALGLAGLVGFCALVPARSRVLEWLGRRSLAIYLLHGLVVMVLVAGGGTTLVPAGVQVPADLVLTALIALLTAFGDGPMRRFFRPPASERAGRRPRGLDASPADGEACGNRSQ